MYLIPSINKYKIPSVLIIFINFCWILLKNITIRQQVVIDIKTPKRHPAVDIKVSLNVLFILVFNMNIIFGPGIADNAEMLDIKINQV